MTDLSPEIQQIFLDSFKWTIGALIALLVFIAMQVIRKMEKLEVSVVNIGEKMVDGLSKVTNALNNHTEDFGKRLGKTDERVAILETITVKLKEDVNGIYPRISIVEQAAATNSARLEKIVHPVGKR